MDSLENIKAGDDVLWHRPFGREQGEIKKVSRTTKTQIVVDGAGRYRRKNGNKVGTSSMWASWITAVKNEEQK